MGDLEKVMKEVFKPEFGNVHHINFLSEVDRLQKEKKALAKKREAQKGGDALEARIVQKEKMLLGQLTAIVEKDVSSGDSE